MVVIKEYEDIYQKQVIDLILDIQKTEGIEIGIEAQRDLENICEFYQSGKGNFWVALDEDMVVGTIALIGLDDKFGAIRKMFVDKSYRGTGLSALLMTTLIEHAKAGELQEIYLGTISIYQAAQRFYLKHGFTQIEKQELPEVFPIMPVDNVFFMKKL